MEQDVIGRELQAIVRTLAIAFPPPDRSALSRAWVAIDRVEPTLRAEERLSELSALAPDDPLAATRWPAVVQCLLSMRFESAHPWPTTLDLVKRCWPEWGTPLLLSFSADVSAVEQVRRAKALDLVGDIGSPDLLSLFDTTRARLEVAAPAYGVVFRQLLARHAPTILHLDRWAAAARRLRMFRDVHEALQLTLDVHGEDPAKWPLKEDFLDLSAAGSLCQTLARIHNRDWPQDKVRGWTLAAFDLLRRSLDVPLSDDPTPTVSRPRAYATARLGDVYLQLLRDPQLGTDDWSRLLDAAQRVIQAHGRSDSRAAFTAQRQLVFLWTATVTRLRRALVAPEQVDRAIETTIRHFEDLLMWASSQKQPEVARWYCEFLVGNERWQQAIDVSRRTSNPMLAEAFALFHKGATPAAVLRLATLLQRPCEDYEAVGYLLLLGRYLADTRPTAARVSERMRQGILEQMQTHLPAVVATCRLAIEQGDAERAGKYLALASKLQPQDERVLELRARLLMLDSQADSPSLPAGDLSRALRSHPAFLENPYLRRAFVVLNTTHAGPHSCSADELWRIASSPSRSGETDVEALAAVLAWQVESGQLDGWHKRFITVAQGHPRDPLVQGLPLTLWTQRQSAARREIDHLLTAAISDDTNSVWSTGMCDKMPGEFFFDHAMGGTLQRIKVACYRESAFATDIIASVVDGFTRGQIDSWLEPQLCDDRTRIAAAWIRETARDNAPWARWLGGQRDHFESVLVRRLEQAVESLRRDLLNSDGLSLRDWHDRLRAFLFARHLHCEPVRQPGMGELVLHHCTQSAETFSPTRLNRTYWRDLNALISGWTRETCAYDLQRLAADLWLELHRRLEVILVERVTSITYQPLHDLKRDIERRGSSQDVGPWMLALTDMLDKTRRYLRWHRMPRIRTVDLREILSAASYTRPFVQVSRLDKPVGHRFGAVRPGSPVWVDGDRELLTEVVRCLLDNAYRSTSASTEAPWIWAQVAASDDNAVCTITDSGTGADPILRAKLNNPRARPFSAHGSTGFGTRLCHRVVGLHGGTLAFLQPNDSGGLTARFDLPLVREGTF